MFAKYYPPEAQDPPMRLDIIAGRLPQAPLRPSAASSTTTKSLVRAHDHCAPDTLHEDNPDAASAVYLLW